LNGLILLHSSSQMSGKVEEGIPEQKEYD